MTDAANPTLDRVETVLKSLLWNTLVDAEIDALIASAPWLAIWPVAPIVRGLLHMLSDRLYAKIKEGVDLQAIVLVNDASKRDYDKAAVTLRIIADEKGVESDEFKRAREAAEEAFGRFVHYGAAA